MSYSILFTQEAEDTYESVVAQLRQRWGPTFVSKFEARVLEAIDTIAASPYLYPVVVEETEIRKCILHKACSLLYKITNQTVVIICFWDNRQDPLFT